MLKKVLLFSICATLPYALQAEQKEIYRVDQEKKVLIVKNPEEEKNIFEDVDQDEEIVSRVHEEYLLSYNGEGSGIDGQKCIVHHDGDHGEEGGGSSEEDEKSPETKQEVLLASHVEPSEVCDGETSDEEGPEGCPKEVEQTLLLAVSCSEGKCPREMIERLREQKKAERGEQEARNQEQKTESPEKADA